MDHHTKRPERLEQPEVVAIWIKILFVRQNSINIHSAVIAQTRPYKVRQHPIRDGGNTSEIPPLATNILTNNSWEGRKVNFLQEYGP